MKIEVLDNKLSEESSWRAPLEDEEAQTVLLSDKAVSLFDQNGYHMTPAEQAYAVHSGLDIVKRRKECVIHQPWMRSKSTTGPHFNHCELFERKNFADLAQSQLSRFSRKNNLLWKLVRMKPKWGIDVSIDYVDMEGRVFEVFHYEWDGFCLEKVQEKKLEIENFVMSADWDHAASIMWKKRSDWMGLDFFEQSLWKTNFYGLSPERFKNIVWSNKI